MPDIPVAQLKARLRHTRLDPDTPLSELRAGLAAATTKLRPNPAVQIRAELTPSIRGEWVWSPQAAEQGSILYLHGGGFVAGSAQTHRALAAEIALASGARVFSVDYRLAPEHPWPAAECDALDGLRWLNRTCSGQRLAVVADSAGAHLALAALLRAKSSATSIPAALALLSPWLDLRLSGDSMCSNAAVDPTLSHDRLSRFADWYLAGQQAPDVLAGDFSGLPPTLIQVGSDEVLRSDAERLAAAMSAARLNVRLEIWPDMFHVWHAYARWLVEARTAIQQVGAFLKSHLRTGP
jgi:acetyl esterase/lipase